MKSRSYPRLFGIGVKHIILVGYPALGIAWSGQTTSHLSLQTSVFDILSIVAVASPSGLIECNWFDLVVSDVPNPGLCVRC
jgi:hypothetical protein